MIGIFHINQNYISKIDKFDLLLDYFLYSNALTPIKPSNKTSRKRIYITDDYHKNLFELAKQKQKVKSKKDLNHLVNLILAQELNARQTDLIQARKDNE